MRETMLNFLGLSAANFDESYGFYRDVVGIRVETVPEWDEWAGLGETWDVQKESAGRGMICEMFGGAPPPPSGRIWGHGQNVRPSMHVSDLARFVDDLQNRGAQFTGDVKETTRGLEIEVSAPEDVRWALVETQRYPTSDSLHHPRIGSVGIKVVDLDAQTRFYHEVLGLEIAYQAPSEVVLEQGPGEPVVILTPNGEAISIDESYREQPLLSQPVWLAVMTSDINEAASRLRTWGVNFYRHVTKHPDWHGTDVVIGDADGNPIQVVQYGSA